ncbi:hypothetical protein [Amphritea sp. HPY]|uniref:hypothetical protein n=1 Tax=Amphritea sp. HPY TaxID=3421652 RepID=UPI003D7EF773
MAISMLGKPLPDGYIDVVLFELIFHMLGEHERKYPLSNGRLNLQINYFWLGSAFFSLGGVYLGATVGMEGVIAGAACAFFLIKADQVTSALNHPSEEDVCFIDLYRGEIQLAYSKGVTAVLDIAIDSFYIRYKKSVKKADYYVTFNDGTQQQRFEVKHHVNYVFFKLHTPFHEKEPNSITVTRKHIN